MLKSHLFITIILASSAFAASKPVEISIDQLAAHPKQFHNKRVLVVGYFDASDSETCEIRSKRKAGNRMFVRFTPSQGRRLDTQPFRKGRVRIVGTFQYKDTTPKKVRDLPDTGDGIQRTVERHPQGWGWMGVYDMQIRDITEFTLLSAR